MATATLAEPAVLNSTQRSILRALLYFDIFQYPLRTEEITRFMGSTGTASLYTELKDLCSRGLLQHSDGHYALRDADANTARRVAGNQRAEERMAKAHRMSRFMGRFPYVRAVMLSGSISKGYLDADADIDYFVITEPGRLWISRTLLIAFKKMFLFNSRRDFCVNYFVDTDHLAIEDRNLFTATEVTTLIPTFGFSICADFFAANAWAKGLLPNSATPQPHPAPTKDRRSKRILERLLQGGFGDEVDEWCMQRTIARWRRKFPELDRAQFDLALRSRRYVSKHHPRNFQVKVLGAFDERLRWFERVHGINLV